MSRSCEPDVRIASFHASAPTRALCPVIVRMMRCFSASQICTLPAFVPIARCDPCRHRQPGSDGQGYTHALDPAQTGDGVGPARFGEVAELRDLGRMCAPQVHAGAEADSEHVCGRPVDEVEVVVVLHTVSETFEIRVQLTASSGASRTLNGTLLSCLGAFLGLNSSFWLSYRTGLTL